MNLKAQIEQDITNTIIAHENLNIQAVIDGIDFKALAHADTQSQPAFSIDKGVATIKVRGLLVPKTDSDYTDYGVTGYNVISDYLTQANDSPMVNHIVLDIDSGGGFVKGLDNVTAQIDKLDKPIDTYASGAMCSAAYWLGCTTNSVSASSNSKIGSIGVYLTHAENSKQLENNGIKLTTFKSGQWKGAFSPNEPLKDFESERLQQSVDSMANEFYSFVAGRRGLNTDDIASLQGDSFNAMTAKQYGLVDSVAPLNSVANSTAGQSTKTATGGNMDLTQALAENTELKQQATQKDAELAVAKAAESAANAKAEQALKDIEAIKAATRTSEIHALATATGKTFSEEETKTMQAMDDTAFGFMVKALKDKPALPQALTTQTLVNGAMAVGDDLDSKFNAWLNEHKQEQK